MYRVWFEDFIDRYYKDFEKAHEACERFIKSQDKDEIPERLRSFDLIGECDICGVVKIKFEDEFNEFAPKEKGKYVVTFVKRECVEVEAYNNNEAEELADAILSEDAYAWEGPADEITVELVEY